MKGSRAASRLLRVFALLLVVAAGLSFTPCTEASGCGTAWTWTTGYGASPSSCAAAESNCFNDAYNNASFECADTNHFLCRTGSFYNDGCFFVGGLYQMDCHLEYVCNAGPDIPD